MNRIRRAGRLIAIEGTDGSGKGTQSRRLVRALRARGCAAERIAFPQYQRSFFGGMVAAYLRGEYGAMGRVDPHLAALLYALDRWSARERILRALTRGAIVVLDRYVDSNKAHQSANLPRGADRQAFMKWIDRVEYGLLGLPRPDFTLVLHVPVQTAYALIGRKARRAHLKGKARDLHEADLRHLRRAGAAYLALARARRAARGALIHCAEGGRLLPPEAIADRILDALTSRGIIPKVHRGRAG